VNVRRILACIFSTVGAVLLLAAGPASPFQVVPVVVVYPFSATTSQLDQEAASRLGVIVATGMANSPGIVVKPAPPGAERKDFLTLARSLGADYYVTGYLSAVGHQVSLVEQVVTTASGIIVFSNTAQLTTYQDAAGQGEDLAAAIVRHANRNIGAIEAPPEHAATPTPGPTAGSEANLSNLGGLLHRKRQATSAPSATPTPAPAAVSPTPAVASTPVALATLSPAAARSSAFGLVTVAGSADAGARAAATQALGTAFASAKRATTPLAPGGIPACNAATVGRIVSGNLTSGENTVLGVKQASASFELVVTDCAGTVQYHQTTLRGAADLTTAIQHAVDAAVSAYIAKAR
jgi:TolB-like protein